MPTLFVCYRRGTAGALQLIERLSLEKYNVWYDWKNIHTGEEDWKIAVDKGIQVCDGVILCLTEQSCCSESIKYEIEKAKELNKRIFPILLEKCNIEECIQYLGLPKNINISNSFIQFTKNPWEEGISKLLEDLQYFGLGVTRHWKQISDIRISDDFQNYLRTIRKALSFLRLSQIFPSKKDRTPIEHIYFPIPIEFNLSVLISDYEITDWWVGKRNPTYTLLSDAKHDYGIINDWPRLETSVLDAIVGEVQKIINGVSTSPYIDEVSRPLIAAPFWEGPVKEDFWPLTAVDAAALSDRIVVIGSPGSGKTTFARHLASCLINSQLDPSIGNLSLKNLGNWPHGALTPVYIKLRNLVNESFPESIEELAETDHLENYIKLKSKGFDGSDVIAKAIIRDLRSGNAVLILDGLDEVPIPSLIDGKNYLTLRRLQIKNLAQSLDNDYACRIIITSRPYAYRSEEWKLDGFQSVTLQPLTSIQKHQIVSKLIQEFETDKSLVFQKEASFFCELKEKSIPESMTNSPLLLTLMVGLFLNQKDNKLPTLRGELYHRSVTLLLDTWSIPRIGDKESLLQKIGCSVYEIYKALEVIAYKSHELFSYDPSAKNEQYITKEILLVSLFDLSKKVDIRDAIEYLSDQAGVLVELGNDNYEFAHRGFEECLAAAFLVREGQKDFQLVRSVIEKNPQIWQETCLLAGDILCSDLPIDKDHTLHKRTGDLWLLIDDLLDDIKTVTDNPQDSRWWSVWLAAKYIQNYKLYVNIDNERMLWKGIYNRLRDWLISLLSTYDALPPLERAECARILGLMGDRRKGIIVPNNTNDLEWCFIPEGCYQIGSSEDKISFMRTQSWAFGQPFDREVPECEVKIGGFYISRFPVTVSQFQAFIKDKNGYNNELLWTKEGWKWRQNHANARPKEFEKWEIPNYPQTFVNWYEAVAFCEWLTQILNSRICLPSEAEWEIAARGVDGRIFPWGNIYDPKRSNTNVSNIGSPTPPGCYLLPDGPWGKHSPLDMSGNVWEWCSSAYRVGNKIFSYPYNVDDGRENMEYGDECRRITRGGSYTNGVFISRVSYRGQDVPSARFDRQGFRVIKKDDNRCKAEERFYENGKNNFGTRIRDS